MASARFKKLFLIKFISYLAIITGTLVSIAQFAPVVAVEFNYRKDLLLGTKHSLAPTILTSQGQSSTTSAQVDQSSSDTSSSSSDEPGFSSLFGSSSQTIKPVSTDYGIVIEKINANAKVIPQVDSSIEKEYVKALLEGVAEAKGSTEPGIAGNLYLFSHSVDAPWNITRYNAIFYLLRELEVGDRVIIFYKGRRYDYLVFDKTIAKPGDVSFLTNRYDKPVLTMQTCDPPGTLLNRLIIRAKLAGS